MIIPLTIFSQENLNASNEDLQTARADVAETLIESLNLTLNAHAISASAKSKQVDKLLLLSAQMNYLAREQGCETLALMAKSAVKSARAVAGNTMPSAVLDMFDTDDMTPYLQDEPLTPSDLVKVNDNSKSDIDKAWSQISTYVEKIKDAIRKVTEKVNKQLQENLQKYLKTGKLESADNSDKITHYVKILRQQNFIPKTVDELLAYLETVKGKLPEATRNNMIGVSSQIVKKFAKTTPANNVRESVKLKSSSIEAYGKIGAGVITFSFGPQAPDVSYTAAGNYIEHYNEATANPELFNYSKSDLAEMLKVTTALAKGVYKHFEVAGATVITFPRGFTATNMTVLTSSAITAKTLKVNNKRLPAKFIDSEMLKIANKGMKKKSKAGVTPTDNSTIQKQRQAIRKKVGMTGGK